MILNRSPFWRGSILDVNAVFDVAVEGSIKFFSTHIKVKV